MATRAHQGLITVDEFLLIDWGSDKKAELDNGVIRMMTGGTRSHSRVQANLIRHLGNALEGSSCRPFGSDMGLRVSELTLRYPDVSIYCGASFAPEFDNEREGKDPKTVIEILSPSTSRRDLGEKLEEYQRIISIDAIIFIEPVGELIRAVTRAGAESWLDSGFSGHCDLVVTSPNVTIARTLVFGR
jgi:Uma2 family endonuclease